jgi:hypothetical protein
MLEFKIQCNQEVEWCNLTHLVFLCASLFSSFGIGAVIICFFWDVYVIWSCILP